MDNYKIMDMSENERPYEKCLSYGPSILSDTELLAVILRTGSKKHNVLEVAGRILNCHAVHKGIVALNFLEVKELMKIEGVGKVKAIQLVCLAELSRRMSKAAYKPFIQFSSPSSIADYYMESYRYLTREKVLLLMFDSHHKLLKEEQISEGTVNQAVASPREIFLEAVKQEAVFIILLHNHPSGDPSPSTEDINLTDRVKNAGSMIGIELSDHIILGNNCYVSMAERGII